MVRLASALLTLPPLCSGFSAGNPTVFVSTSGSDANEGTSASAPVATLQRAKQVARAVAAATVQVAQGTYQLTAPLELDAKDSGVRWVAGGGAARVSGGAVLGPWVASPLGQGIVQTDVSKLAGSQDRHLYVNGVRAQRTRMAAADAAAVFAGAQMTDDGFALAAAHSAEVVPVGSEFVYPQSTSPWTEPRCAVASRDNATFVTMQQPCWRNLVHKACGQGAKGPPSVLQSSRAVRKTYVVAGLGAPLAGRGYVENVGASGAMSPGSWALQAGGTVVYALRAGETAATLRAVMPTLDLLLSVTGAHDVRFEGFAFEHASWLRPGQAEGYVEQQTGCGTTVANANDSSCTDDYYWSFKSPGNVRVADSRAVAFVRCEFARLGGFGLDVSRSSDCVIDGCLFQDISGSAVQIGEFQDPLGGHATRGNVVRQCVVERAAAEYSGAAGINVGYTVGTVLEHNDVGNLTYGAISVGWGWSRHACGACTDAANNSVRYNRVHDYKRTLNDGGGIYMLGPQNGSLIHGNWVHAQGTPTSGALYPDEGSAYSTWYDNVVTDIGTSKWLHLWTSSIHNVTVRDNWADTSYYLNHGTDCPMINNTVFPPGQPPPEAQRIMRFAGVNSTIRAHWAAAVGRRSSDDDD